MVYGGDGLARLPADEQGRSKAVFVPFVLAGERVEGALTEDKRAFARAQVEQILEASPHRINPPCPYFARCGGCHYQQADYRHQLEIKTTVLRENLRRIAKVELENELVIHPSPEWNYRNRTRLKVQSKPDFALGFYRHASHELLPIEQCPISSPLINRAMAALWNAGRAGEIPPDVKEIELFASAEDDQLLVSLYYVPQITKDMAEQAVGNLRPMLPGAIGVLALQSDDTENPLAQPRQIASAGAKELTYNTQSASYRVSGGAFFQVNRHLVDELIDVVNAGRSGPMALDLFAGVGLFSTILARSFAQVIAVEASPTAHSDLSYNSPSNVEAVHATTDQFLQRHARLQADLVVLDPPRAGLGEKVVRNLSKLEARRITYVSCDPATLARDLAGLLAAGYRVEQLHLVDLFPQTFHVESVVHLAR